MCRSPAWPTPGCAQSAASCTCTQRPDIPPRSWRLLGACILRCPPVQASKSLFRYFTISLKHIILKEGGKSFLLPSGQPQDPKIENEITLHHSLLSFYAHTICFIERKKFISSLEWYLWITTLRPMEGAAQLSVTIRDKIKHYEAK